MSGKTRRMQRMASKALRGAMRRSLASNAAAGASGGGEEESLTTSEIKALLDRARIDYRDLYEKEELLSRMRENIGRIARAAAQPATGTTATDTISSLDADERAGMNVFESCSPSVVNISTSRQLRNPLSLSTQEMPSGTGSGVVWDSVGHLVTNYHVIANANRARVSTSDGSRYDARLVGSEPEKDLAMLRIDGAQSLKPVSLGLPSSQLKPGQRVYALGNPFGLDSTLTCGIVSGLDREFQSMSGRTIRGVIQSDAAINPGNSGGALLDSRGRLIGINSAIYSPSGAFSGVGMAVPLDTVRRVATMLIRDGKVTRPVLGISTVPDQISRRLLQGELGVIVAEVQQNTGAAKAGLQSARFRPESGRIELGDIVVAIDGNRVETTEDLLSVCEQKNRGDTATLSVKRGGLNGPSIDTRVTLQ